jgi:hypothetical protein
MWVCFSGRAPTQQVQGLEFKTKVLPKNMPNKQKQNPTEMWKT